MNMISATKMYTTVTAHYAAYMRRAHAATAQCLIVAKIKLIIADSLPLCDKQCFCTCKDDIRHTMSNTVDDTLAFNAQSILKSTVLRSA
jgi:hypothetical protein